MCTSVSFSLRVLNQGVELCELHWSKFQGTVSFCYHCFHFYSIFIKLFGGSLKCQLIQTFYKKKLQNLVPISLLWFENIHTWLWDTCIFCQKGNFSIFVFLNTYVHTYESLPIYQVSIELDMQCGHFFAVLYTYIYVL